MVDGWKVEGKGIEDAAQLSERACGRLRAKHPELQRAPAGRVTERHRYHLGQFLRHWEGDGRYAIKALIHHPQPAFPLAYFHWKTRIRNRTAQPE